MHIPVLDNLVICIKVFTVFFQLQQPHNNACARKKYLYRHIIDWKVHAYLNSFEKYEFESFNMLLFWVISKYM